MEIELYEEAAKVLGKAREKQATLKTLIYASKYRNTRQLFALVNECNRYQKLLEEILSQCPDNVLLAELANGNTEMAHVMLYEHLFGHKFGRAVSLRKTVQKYKHQIKTSVDKVLLNLRVKTLSEAAEKMVEKISLKIPRYMRVNLVKSSVEAVIEEFQSEGWSCIGKLDINKFSEGVQSLNKQQFAQDPLLFDVLVFPAGTDLHEHHLTKSGVLVQQDRASCIPAHVLKPTRGSVVLDCCSAPGNKTSHLASLMGNEGRIIALDRDGKRMATMSKLLKRSGATCIEMIVQDFLTVQVDSDDARDIKFILVDPSCSGSGMMRTGTEKFHATCDSQRLQMLKRFQISILMHALHFPQVERVVYSTCSVHVEENEEVVEEVMCQVSELFQFCLVCPDWRGSRGLDGYPHSQLFLRLLPEQDLTQGFFVACFQRVKHSQNMQTEGIRDEEELCRIKRVRKCEHKKTAVRTLQAENAADLLHVRTSRKATTKSAATLNAANSNVNIVNIHSHSCRNSTLSDCGSSCELCICPQNQLECEAEKIKQTSCVAKPKLKKKKI